MDRLELLKKIQALAKNGVGGEKFNAQQKLSELMEKYHIRDEDLETEVIKSFDFRVGNKMEKELLGQIAYSVYGDKNEKKGYYSYIHIKNKMCVECTDAEFLEIEAKFSFYKHELKKQIDRFYQAFIQANEIFPNPELCKSKEEKFFLSEEDMKILRMAKGIEKSEFLKQIEG